MAGWKFVSQRPTYGRGPDGQFGPVVEVTFRTEGGTLGTVDIPRADYTQDKATAMIDAYAAELDALSQHQ